MLDDDYTTFENRFDNKGNYICRDVRIKDLDSYTFKKIASDIVSPEHGYTGYIVYRKQK